jgi:serine/threonine protein phosphatase PrpC
LSSNVSGETTAVLLVVRDRQVYGASVGDSGAFALTTDACFELTDSQLRKPLVGSGSATPVGFGPFPFNDRILVASDGLLDYVPRSAFKQLALFSPLPEAVDKLISSARLPSGGLQDDISVVLLAPQHHS